MGREQPVVIDKPPQGWRLFAGVALFMLGLFSPLFIPVVTATELPTGWKTVLSGLLALGIPEVLWIAGVAVLGKSGFEYLKARVFGFIKKYGPPETVSRTRYRIGLVMFAVPILFGWLAPYAPHLIPGYEAHRFMINLAGDVMFISSLFVLGGEFWDKVRALFIHGMKVQDSADEMKGQSQML